MAKPKTSRPSGKPSNFEIYLKKWRENTNAWIDECLNRAALEIVDSVKLSLLNDGIRDGVNPHWKPTSDRNRAKRLKARNSPLTLFDTGNLRRSVKVTEIRRDKSRGRHSISVDPSARYWPTLRDGGWVVFDTTRRKSLPPNLRQRVRIEIPARPPVGKTKKDEKRIKDSFRNFPQPK